MFKLAPNALPRRCTMATTAEPAGPITATETDTKQTRVRYFMLFMLFALTVVNYADRSTPLDHRNRSRQRPRARCGRDGLCVLRLQLDLCHWADPRRVA